MNAIARIGLGATLGLLALSCSAGTLGNAGTGGTGGVLTGEGPGNGGQGGGTGGSRIPDGELLQLPGCLRNLLRACSPQGSCIVETVSSGVANACFVTGVRASGHYGAGDVCANNGVVMNVSTANGTPCYTYEQQLDASCQVTRYVWKDIAGNIVASGTSSASPIWTTEITCSATGETAMCSDPPGPSLSSGCCGVSEFGAASCDENGRISLCSSGPTGSCPGVGSSGVGGGMGVGGTGGGVGGTGATGGTGGTAGAADLELPDCVKDLVASCATDGACTVPAMDGGPETDVCFDSGVHATFATVADTNSCGGRRVVQVTRADGSPCYSYEKYVSNGTACEGTVYTWKDAAGQVVATGTSNPYSTPSHQITCTNGGQKKTCHNPIIFGSTGACCGITEVGVAGCAPPVVHGRCRTGTCP